MKTNFKKYWSLGIALAVMVAMMIMVPRAQAADAVFSKFMVGTSAGGQIASAVRTVGAYALIAGDNNRQVVITSISGTSDGTATTHNLYVFDKENEATVNSTSAAGASAIGISSGGASFDANDTVIIQSPGGDVYVESIASTGATTMAINGTLDVQISSGWKIYEMEVIGHIPIGNATLSYNSDVAVVAGTKASPVLLLLGGSTACSINFASGHYR